MNLYKVKISNEKIIKANNEQEAYEQFWESIAENNETGETYLNDCIGIEHLNIDYSTSTDEELDAFNQLIEEEICQQQ